MVQERKEFSTGAAGSREERGDGLLVFGAREAPAVPSPGCPAAHLAGIGLTALPCPLSVLRIVN